VDSCSPQAGEEDASYFQVELVHWRCSDSVLHSGGNTGDDKLILVSLVTEEVCKYAGTR
jgi:hypothetical protein